MFSTLEIKKYKTLAKQYNKLGLGDQAAFFLKPVK